MNSEKSILPLLIAFVAGAFSIIGVAHIVGYSYYALYTVSILYQGILYLSIGMGLLSISILYQRRKKRGIENET